MQALQISTQDRHVIDHQDPLTTYGSRPLDNYDSNNETNEEVHAGLVNNFNKNKTAGYFQSHPYDQIFTAQDMAVDELTLANNYMRIIFGGDVDEKTDNIHMAYNHTIRARADAATTKENTLYELNPLDFVEGKKASKDSLLETFAEQRQFWKGQIDSDTERALKQRPTHKMIHTTTYGKNITPGGQAARFNHVTGQMGHLQFRPKTDNFFPNQDLSSNTFAPQQDGTEVPLNYQNLHDDDPRKMNITNQPKIDVPSAVSTYNFNHAGTYAGSEVSRYTQNYVNENPTFSGHFKTSGQRRWI